MLIPTNYEISEPTKIFVCPPPPRNPSPVFSVMSDRNEDSRSKPLREVAFKGAGGGGLHENFSEIDFLIVSDRGE